MINLQLNHEQIINFSKNPARCSWPRAYVYSLNQWEALNRYVDDVILEIDNNLSERTLRMVVIGQKNYCYSPVSGLAAGCKLNGIDPFRYFRDILVRVSTQCNAGYCS